MLGDLRVLDLGDELLLDTERVALQALFNMIRRYKLGSDVELHKRTLELALLSLIGPQTRDRSALEAEHDNRARRDRRSAGRAGADRRRRRRVLRRPRSRCGARRARPSPEVDEETAEIVRVERGRPRYGAELDDGVIPQEAGLNERAVSFTKGCYVGQETVARLHYRGKPNRHLRGLRLSAPARPATSCASARRRSAGSARSSSPPSTARSRSRSCGARRRPATPSPWRTAR